MHLLIIFFITSQGTLYVAHWYATEIPVANWWSKWYPTIRMVGKIGVTNFATFLLPYPWYHTNTPVLYHDSGSNLDCYHCNGSNLDNYQCTGSSPSDRSSHMANFHLHIEVAVIHLKRHYLYTSIYLLFVIAKHHPTIYSVGTKGLVPTHNSGRTN